MNIRFLCIFIFLMCAFTAGIVNARTLHVGNKSFELSQTKYTTPSLAFAVPNEATWYAPLTTQNLLITTLRLNINNQKYSLCTPPEIQNVPENCDCIFTDTENYTYDNDGRLIGADENLYLQSTGTQYIKTNYYFTGGYASIDIYLKHNQTGWDTICGTQGSGNRSFYISQNFYATTANISIPQTSLRMSVSLALNHNIHFYQNNDTHYAEFTVDDTTLTHQYAQNSSMITGLPLTIFSKNSPSQQGEKTELGRYNLHSFKITDNGILVHHFVPVPACMRIGDFVVPENGMWDIVEQKFYGNSGSGSFIYGKDE